MLQRPAIIADVDNTLYNFIDFFGTAFRAMLHAISAKTEIKEAKLVESFRVVYSKYQSLEYPFSVQELPAIQELNLSRDRLDDVIHAAKVAFGQSRKRRLKLYPNVKETLAWLKSQGYTLVAYTDGPFGPSGRRLRHLGVLSSFDAVIGWGPLREGKVVPVHLISENIGKWFVDAQLPPPASKSKVRERYVQGDDLKPNPALLRDLIAEMKLDSHNSWLVGDSKAKDLLPAREVGLHDVWARYGRHYDKENWDTLVSISPWRESAIRREESSVPGFAPSYTIDDFSDLRTIIPPLQNSLF